MQMELTKVTMEEAIEIEANYAKTRAHAMTLHAGMATYEGMNNNHKQPQNLRRYAMMKHCQDKLNRLC